MKRTRQYILLALVSASALLAGCETVPNAGSTANTPAPAATPATGGPATPNLPAVQTPPPPPVLSPDQIALNEGVELYNKGQFNEAIKRLNVPELSNGTVPNQVSALKYTAFSYCLTNRQTLCRQQFEKAFKLDPAFDLAQGEHGHPMWGKAFARAKPVAAKPAPLKPAVVKPAPAKAPGAMVAPATTPAATR